METWRWRTPPGSGFLEQQGIQGWFELITAAGLLLPGPAPAGLDLDMTHGRLHLATRLRLVEALLRVQGL